MFGLGKRGLRRMAKRSAMTVGGWGRTPVGSSKNPMQYTTRKGKTLTRKQVGASGLRRMGAAGAGGTMLLSSGRSSGSQGRPPSHSSGGRMMM